MWAEVLLIAYAIMIVLSMASFFALLARRPLRTRSGLVMLLSASAHTLGAVLQLFFDDYSSLLVIYIFNSLMFVLIITSVLLFMIQFTGAFDVRDKRLRIALFGLPVISSCLIATDPWLHLYNRSYEVTTITNAGLTYLKFDPNIGYYIWTVYCIGSSIFFVTYFLAHVLRNYDRPVLLVSIGCTAVMFVLNLAANIWPEIYVVPIDGLSFTFVAIFFYTSAFFYGLFDAVPVARNKMLDMMEDAVIAVDSNGTISDVNLSGVKLLGESKGEIIGQRFDDLVERIGWLAPLMGMSIEQHAIPEVEGKDGRMYEAKAVPLQYGHSSKQGSMIILHDLTQRKKMEEALMIAESQRQMAESERKYHVLVDNQTEAIITFDLDGFILFENPVFETYRRLLYPNAKDPNIIKILNPQTRAALLASIAKATPDSPRIGFHEPLILPSGEEMNINWRGKVKFDRSGRPLEVQAVGSDITELIRNEKELKLRAQILDSTHDAIFLHDELGKVIYLNDSARSMIGVKGNSVRGIDLTDHMVMPMGFADVIHHMEGWNSFHYDASIKRRDGPSFPIEVSSQIVVAYGKTLVLSIVRDTSDMERSRHALMESETRYRELITNQGEGTMYSDVNDRIEFANPAAEEIFGVRSGQLIGRTLFEFVDEKGLKVLREQIERKKNSKGRFSIDIIRPQGDRRTIQFTVTPRVGKTGDVTGFFEVLRDITEEARTEQALRRSEAEYRAIVGLQKEMIIRRSRDGTITFVNEAAAKFIDRTIPEIVGTKLLPAAEEDELRKNIKEIESLTPDNPDRDSLVLRITLNDGSTRWTEWRVRGIFDDHGELIEVQAVGNDITLKLKMEQELIKTQKLESIGLLAGGIAHDFNNLLSSMVSNMELALMDVPEGSGVKQRIDESVKAAMSARRLTQQLLTFSKGGMPVKEVIDVGTLLRSSAEFTLTGSRVNVDYAIGDGLHFISADPFQIGQVINNIVINAVQSMPNGGTMTIRASNFENDDESHPYFTERHYVRIDLSDEGEGIPPEVLPKIFDPFFTTKEKGSGIGLLTVQSILLNHNGHIDVESELGKGTTFTIYLPAHLDARMEASVQDAPEAAGCDARILVMDDDPSILDVITMILNELGYEVAGARNGEEAIALYRHGMEQGTPFDLVIMDLTVRGGIGGKEAIGRILEMDPGAKAIVSSGYSNDSIMSNPGQYGFRDILQKPYTITDLSAKIGKILNN